MLFLHLHLARIKNRLFNTFDIMWNVIKLQHHRLIVPTPLQCMFRFATSKSKQTIFLAPKHWQSIYTKSEHQKKLSSQSREFIFLNQKDSLPINWITFASPSPSPPPPLPPPTVFEVSVVNWMQWEDAYFSFATLLCALYQHWHFEPFSRTILAASRVEMEMHLVYCL